MRNSVVLLALAAPLVLLAQTADNDPFVGTWKLNVAKSKYSPGPAMKSETVTIGADGKVTVDGVETNGQPETWSYTYSAGNESPITGIPDSSVVEKRSGNRIEHTWKIGQGRFKGKGVLSDNGKTMTYTMDGTDEQGRHEHDLLMFEKAMASSPGMEDTSAGPSTWKLNVAKSQFSPGPPPQSVTVTIGADRKTSVEEVGPNGQTLNYSFDHSEGTAVPITGMQDATISEKTIDPHTFEHTWKMGEMTLMGRGVISDDGKTLTYTMTGTTPDGKALHNVEIFDKQ